MIISAVQIETRDLITQAKPAHINVRSDADGHLQSIKWHSIGPEGNLQFMAKTRGATWDREACGWVFQSEDKARDFYQLLRKRHPDWLVLGDPGVPTVACKKVQILRVPLSGGREASVMQFPLPYFAAISCKNFLTYQLTRSKRQGELVLFIGRKDDMGAMVESLVAQGAKINPLLAKEWAIVPFSKLRLKVSGWAIRVSCDLGNPLHYLAAPEQMYRSEGRFPFHGRFPIPWDGHIPLTRKSWPEFEAKLRLAGLEWQGDDPAKTSAAPVGFDPDRVPGWHALAPNGKLLHEYQKEGAAFCASRGMRALIGDEMGVGKTVQAIAAAEAVGAPRIVVVCPASARFVWESEIVGWGGRGAIQHLESQLDRLDPGARWHILTYDLIAAKASTWTFCDEGEEREFVRCFPDLATNIEGVKKVGGSRKISIDAPMSRVPQFADSGRIALWNRMMQRLRSELLEQILDAGQMLVILDEAHRVKNKEAKRTKAVQRIVRETDSQLLMLTGTPLRNNEHEAAVLLSILDVDASTALSKRMGYTIDDVKDYLGFFMIRRTKSQVLPQLPEKTRQRIEICELDAEHMAAYNAALYAAQEVYLSEISGGSVDQIARQRMQGCIERARNSLGIAKVRGGAISELVSDVVASQGCCVVFCAHHQVTDELRRQLESENLRVAVIDGRIQPRDRAALVNDFQTGAFDVCIGGIHSAGEAITLARASTAIFVELDWVPAALLQAEDRIHRVGQINSCHIVHVVARMAHEHNLDQIMIDLIAAKFARIGSVLGENADCIIANSIQTDLQTRLMQSASQRGSTKPPRVEYSGTYAPADADPSRAAQFGRSPCEQDLPDGRNGEPHLPNHAGATKRKRGRPRIYLEESPPTPTERAQKSVKNRADMSGKKVMLRLTAEAHDALKAIMALTGETQTTSAINAALIARKAALG